MKSFYSFFLLSLVLASACKNDNASKNKHAGIDLERAIDQAESRRSASPARAGDNTCLLGYQTKYDELLSTGLVLSATGFSSEVMTTQYNKVLKPEHHSYQFKFLNKRIGKIKGLSGELELPDIVAVQSIKPMTPDQFAQSYRAVTSAEMEVAKETLEDMTDQSEQQEVEKETTKKAGNSLLNTFREVSEAYSQVAGLGDNASWNSITNELAVLQKGVKFEIRAEISNDTEKNKSVAIELAKAVLSKCQ
ncbi:hypothetical protein [Pseudoflavitalea rhizosphaerae]|uniref:hypothetical protein n=1 Tax=Pseudoflavitalea rhizosphaerae TaxID=1884793 RepID=UPI000F8D981C|nr:hypothetical protein [Pseudoflavitalea rhizosphaerae]